MDKNMNKGTKRSNVLLGCIVLLGIILVVESAILLKTLKTNKENKTEINMNTIQTPVVDLFYNIEMVDSLKATVMQEAPYETTILADIGKVKDIELFTLSFGDEKGQAVGYILNKNSQRVLVNLEKHEISVSENISVSMTEKLYRLQEDLIDTILSNMDFVEFITGDNYNEEDYIKVETPYVPLLFSKEWEEYLQVKHVNGDSYEVMFYCKLPDKDSLELFTYIFGDKGELLIGHYNDIEVGIIEAPDIADELLTEEEKMIYYTMKEEMNCIIDGLVKEEGFNLN